MTGKTFLNTVANGEIDVLQLLLDILKETNTPYCLVGGLAVNAYVEPVVSLDLDIVVAVEAIENICSSAEKNVLKVEKFRHSVILTSSKSDLRNQLQTDERYQPFVSRSLPKQVLGYEMRVASKDDVLQGKVWAYLDETRRKSKRQKDLADIARLIETYPELKNMVPPLILERLS